MMKARQLRKLLTISPKVFIVLICFFLLSFGKNDMQESQLRLELKIDNETDGIVIFKYCFKNNTSKTVLINKYFMTNLMFFKLYITDENGNSVSDSCARVSEDYDSITSNKKNYISIRPNKLYQDYLITYGCGYDKRNFKFFFNKNKKYKIWLEYEFNKYRLSKRLTKTPAEIYYKAWAGRIVSDTLELNPKKDLYAR